MLQLPNLVPQICVAEEKKDVSLAENHVNPAEKHASLANLKEEEKRDNADVLENLAEVVNLDHEKEEIVVEDLDVLVENREAEHIINLEAMFQILPATPRPIHLEVCHGLLVQ